MRIYSAYFRMLNRQVLVHIISKVWFFFQLFLKEVHFLGGIVGCPVLTKILNFMMQSWIGVRLWMNITGKNFFSISSTGTFNTRGSKSAQIAKCRKKFSLEFCWYYSQICGIKFRSRSYISFCSTTNTFWVIIDLVAFFAIFNKFARKRHLLRVYSKSICLVEQNGVYGHDRNFFRKNWL